MSSNDGRRPGADARLDDLDGLRKADPSGMLAAVADLPAQCRRAAEDWRPPERLPGRRPPRRLYVMGMGGSAMGGDLLRAFLQGRAATPVQVVRDYSLPAGAGPEDTGAACSYSGETEETLSAYNDARARGLFTICLTTGGRLAREGKRAGDPVVAVPKTLQPRAALGSFFFKLLRLAGDLGMVAVDSREIDETLSLLDRKAVEFGPETPFRSNPAKKLAEKFYGRCPLIYTSAPFGPVGDRWRCQLNENAKTFAHSGVIPEMCHNEIEGFGFPAALRRSLAPVLIHDPAAHPRIKTRFRIVAGLLADAGLEPLELEPEGETVLAGIFHLILLGDFVSSYLAVLNGIDPTPMANIDRLKSLLLQTEPSPEEP